MTIVHIFIMNFLRLSEQIPDEGSSIQFLRQRGVIDAQRWSQDDIVLRC